MQHKLLVYIYDKSITGSRDISRDNFADKKIIVYTSFIQDKIKNIT